LIHGFATGRKLAAIMIADVAGFSRLMERDESLTFARLRRLREEVIYPKIEEHGGRVVKTTGDGFLAEFGSAIGAVRCGVEIQRSVIALEAIQADLTRIHFRIGLNVGDVIIDGEDVAGDGVNVAARLENLSPADGMCISALVREQIREDLDVVFEDMGEQTLKNISRPVRAYAVRFKSSIPETEQHAPPQPAIEPGPSLDYLVQVETDFDAVLGAGGGANKEAAKVASAEDDKMLREAEARARSEAEERAGAEAQRRARQGAGAAATPEEEASRDTDKAATREQEHAELLARLEAENEETERHFAEMEKELEAEQAAAALARPAAAKLVQAAVAEVARQPESRQDARKREEEEASARARAEAALEREQAKAEAGRAPVLSRAPIKWGKPVALVLCLILLLGVVLVHLVSFGGYIPQFEKVASAHLRLPVKIKALHLSLVPQPHWRLEGVSVGEQGQLAVERIDAIAEIGSMFSAQKVFKSIELDSPALSEEGLSGFLFGKPQGGDLKVASIVVKNAKLASKAMILPAVDAKIAMGADGGWQKITLETADHKTSLLLESRSEGAQLEIETNAFSMPFSPAFILEDFSAKGVLGRDELRLSEFKGAIYGGYLSGTADLKWGGGWSLGGAISVRAMDPGRFAPALLEEGKLEGKAEYAMRAKSYEELFAAPRLGGSFAVQKGSLLGVDLGRLLQGGTVGGRTAFAELSGNFVSEGGKTQLRQVHLVAGPVTAGGNADADALKNISGRFAVELRSPVAQARANLTVSGTLKEPRFNP
jgi:class 3 adenylate cyclase